MDQKRTIDELNTLYELEPDIRDVYVEGTTDKHFVDWYLRRKGHNNVTVYPIDVIEIPQDILISNNLSVGSNRAKVVALSYELVRQQAVPRRVMCIIDRDSDDETDCINGNPYLFVTDGNSLELYALTTTVIEKFLLVALAGFPITADNLIPKLNLILEAIYSIRQANVRLKFGMEWISFCSYINIDAMNISFRESDFIRAYLQKNRKWQYRDRFNSIKNEIQCSLSPQATRRIRGHDLSELLHIVVKKFKKDRAFTNSSVLEGCLMASIETRDLEPFPLFTSLESHASSV
jgi:hypothetical protein